MKHFQRLLLLALAICCYDNKLYAQGPEITYFEVSAQPAYAQIPGAYLLNPDSTQAWITNLDDTCIYNASLILTIANPSLLTSLQLTLANSQDTEVYNTSNSLSYWQGNHPFRLQNDVLYLTINAGQYSSLKRFTATATITYDSGMQLTKVFEKN